MERRDFLKISLSVPSVLFGGGLQTAENVAALQANPEASQVSLTVALANELGEISVSERVPGIVSLNGSANFQVSPTQNLEFTIKESGYFDRIIIRLFGFPLTGDGFPVFLTTDHCTVGPGHVVTLQNWSGPKS